MADSEIAPGLGHNGGPELEPARSSALHDADGGWKRYCWQVAVDAAWKDVPYEVVVRRVTRAEKLGMTYRAYTLEILERGRYLQAIQIKNRYGDKFFDGCYRY